MGGSACGSLPCSVTVAVAAPPGAGVGLPLNRVLSATDLFLDLLGNRFPYLVLAVNVISWDHSKNRPSASESALFDAPSGSQVHKETRSRRGAPAVHKFLPLPVPPGNWFDPPDLLCKRKGGRCLKCGEKYEDFRIRRHNHMYVGNEALKYHNYKEAAGYFPSFGPVLWQLRVEKLYAFYARHQGCGVGPCPELVLDENDDSRVLDFFDDVDPVPF